MTRRLVPMFAILMLLSSTVAGAPDEAHSARDETLAESPVAVAGALPISFEPNEGQAAPDVDFLARGAGFNLNLSANELALTLGEGAASHVAMKLFGGNPTPAVAGVELLQGRINHLIGTDPARWLTNVPTYASVVYRSVYPGVDLVVKGTDGLIEYDFVIAPGGNPRDISLGFSGVDDVSADTNGDLVLRSGAHTIRHRAPFIFQDIDGELRAISGRFVLRTSGEVGFAVDAYDTTQALVIDPVIEYSATNGGTSDEENGLGIAVDGTGSAYLTGYTVSGGDWDAYVVKLDAAGEMAYTTYLGGAGLETTSRVVVDDDGNAYVVGITDSTDFPTNPEPLPTPAQASNGGGYDAFVAKLDESGGLVFSTFLGGTGDENGADIAIDDAGKVYITGNTDSGTGDFPTTEGAYQETFGGGSLDAFVAVVTADGAQVDYATFLGGSKHELGGGIAVDGGVDPGIYITGTTTSPTTAGFPTTDGAYRETYGGAIDVFVAKLNPANPTSHLEYSTYLGGTSEDHHGDIAIDDRGGVFVAGYSQERDVLPVEIDFPRTDGAYQPDYGGGGSDAFVSKLELNGLGGLDLIYSTYLGGDGDDYALALAVKGAGEAHVAGWTTSTDFPTLNEVEPGDGTATGDAFIAKLAADGSAVWYSSLLGGADHDVAIDVAIDVVGGAYVIGQTDSTTVFAKKIATTTPNAMYVWRAPRLNGTPIDYAEAERLADFAVAEGIGTLIYDNWGCGLIPPEDEPHPINCPDGVPPGAELQDASTLAPIIALFHSRGLQIEALYTDNGSRSIGGTNHSRVEEVVAYNASVASEARFDAIRLNIESFACGADVLDDKSELVHVFNQPGPPCASGDDLDVFRTAVAQADTLPVYVSVGHTWLLTHEIQDIVSGIDVQTVQDNQATPTGYYGRAIERLSAHEVCRGNDLGKPVSVTIETYDVVNKLADPLSHFNTFFEEGEATMVTTLSGLDFAAEVEPRGYVPPCPQPVARGITYHFYRESYGSPILPKWAADADLDSIADGDDLGNGAAGVDSTTGFSNAFTDGATSGTIMARGHQNLMVADALDSGDGIVVTASYQTTPVDNPDDEIIPDPAMIAFSGECTPDPDPDPGAVLTIRAGDQVIVTCGSITVDVVRGAVAASFIGTNGTIATSSVSAGSVVTFQPATSKFTTPASNPAPVVVVINGQAFDIMPGAEETFGGVTIDIKPGSDSNSINLKSKGVIPVAIITTDDFDATSVDPLSVRFGPGHSDEKHGMGHYEDVDDDGDTDLVLHFPTQASGIALGDGEACLTGVTFDDVTITGCDMVAPK